MAKPPSQTRDYQRGYAAGRRSRDRDRFDRFYAAAMTGLLAAPSGWGTTTDGVFKPDCSPKDYAWTAKQIAQAMMKEEP